MPARSSGPARRPRRGRPLTLAALGAALVAGAAGLLVGPSNAAASTYLLEGTKLTAPDETPDQEGKPHARFGASVAISADGSTIAVGGPLDGTYGSVGGAWVFARAGAEWSEQARIGGGEDGPTPDSHIGIGESIALSGDGSTAVLGSSGAPDGRPIELRAYHRAAGTWSADGVIDPGGGASWAAIPPHAALSFDGREAILSGSGPSVEIDEAGAGGWHQTQLLTPMEVAGEGALWSGSSLALSADGSTLLVGQAGDANGAGAAWVFVRSPSGWVQQGPKLTVPESTRFGAAVALSADGSIGLVGAPGSEEGRGAAWLLRRSGSTWSAGPELGLLRRLGAGRQSEEEERTYGFGTGVALSPDGAQALIGAPGLEDGSGGVFAFGPHPEAEPPASPLIGAGESGQAEFGAALALAPASGQLLVGGPADGGLQAGEHGAVWLFSPGRPTREPGPGGSGAGSSAPATSSSGGPAAASHGSQATLATSISAPSRAELLRFLGALLRPATLSASARRNGLARRVHAPEPGILTLRWWSASAHGGRVLLAYGRMSLARSGTAVLVLHLTRPGRSELAGASTRVLASAAFTSPAGLPVALHRVLTVHG